MTNREFTISDLPRDVQLNIIKYLDIDTRRIFGIIHKMRLDGPIYTMLSEHIQRTQKSTRVYYHNDGYIVNKFIGGLYEDDINVQFQPLFPKYIIRVENLSQYFAYIIKNYTYENNVCKNYVVYTCYNPKNIRYGEYTTEIEPDTYEY